MKLIVWLRRDLRLHDNPALYEAVKDADEVLPLFVLDEAVAKTDKYGDRRFGGAQKWWLHHSLESVAADLHKHHVPLILRRGDSAEILDSLIEEWGADGVYWNRRYTPWGIKQDSAIKSTLKKRGVVAKSFKAGVLIEPEGVSTKSKDKPYTVYTPYWKTIRPEINRNLEKPLPVPSFKKLSQTPNSDDLSGWDLLPTKPDWATGFGEVWIPGEAAARQKLSDFIDSQRAAKYKDQRNIPSIEGTSRMSPHLAMGEISPRTIWYAVSLAMEQTHGNSDAYSNMETYLSEVAWREFSYNLMFYYPHTMTEPLRDKYKKVPWVVDEPNLKRWQQGQTGIPIVDAGMRQLWQTGWMHNRVRMIVGSLLVKNLLIPWQEGEQWFWDTLVDADPASNVLGWQWVAGCGADAAPYFRIFNPVSQGERYDPKGEYVRELVPELAELPDKYIHKPWQASEDLLARSKITLGEDYPRPIVDLKKSRQRALDAYAQMKD